MNLVKRTGSSFVPVNVGNLKPTGSESDPSRSMATGMNPEPGTSQSKRRISTKPRTEQPQIDESLAVTQIPEQDLDFTAPSYSWESDLKSDSINEVERRDFLIDDVKNPFEEDPEIAKKKISDQPNARSEPVFEPLNINEASKTPKHIENSSSQSEQAETIPGKNPFRPGMP